MATCILQGPNTIWQMNNFTCKDGGGCKPNPCLHGGKCITLGPSTLFRCDCFGTAYKGATCAEGVIIKPNYPPLIVNKTSAFLKLVARPDVAIKITITSEDNSVKFQPSILTIVSPQTEGYTRVTAKKAGLIRVRYRISGPSSLEYPPLKDDVVFAFLGKKTAKLPYVTIDFYKQGCYNRPIGNCGKNTISLSSTCQWIVDNAGFISVTVSNLTLPVSLVGAHSTTTGVIDMNGIISADMEVESYLRKGILPKCATKDACQKAPSINDANLKFILDNNLFTAGFYSSIKILLPFWMQLKVRDSISTFRASNIKSAVAKGRAFKNSSVCPGVVSEDDDMYTLFSHVVSSQIQFLSEKVDLPKRITYCFAINLCKRRVHFRTSKNNKISLTNSFSSTGLAGFNVSIQSFTLGGVQRQPCMEVLVTNNIMQRHCIEPNSIWKASGTFTSQMMMKTAIINFEGIVNAQIGDLQQAPLKKFLSNHKMMIDAFVSYDIRIKMLNKFLMMKSYGNRSRIFVNVGGSSDGCPVCTQKGIKIIHPSKEEFFDFSLSTIRLLPSQERPIQLTFYLDGYGGQVINLKNKNSLLLQLRVLSRMDHFVRILKAALSVKHLNLTNLIQIRMAPVITAVNNVRKLLSNQSVSYKTVYVTIQELQSHAFELKAVLTLALNRLRSDPLANLGHANIRFLLSYITRINKLDLTPKITPVKVKEYGVEISYSGGICIHRLCIRFANMSLTDLQPSVSSDPLCDNCSTFDRSKISDSVFMTGNANQNISFGKRIHMPFGTKFFISPKKTVNELFGSLPIKMFLFGNLYQTELKLSILKVQFRVEKVTVANGLAFTVYGTQNIQTALWRGLTKRILGNADKSSATVTKLKMRLQSVFSNIAKKTTKRTQLIKNKVKEYGNAFVQQQLIVAKAQKQLTVASENLRKSQLRYRRQVVLLNRLQTEFKSYLKGISPLFIERNVNRVCQLKQCKETCVTMPVCKLCQDPVSVDVETLKCDPVKQKIRTRQVVPFETTCEVRKYQFIPIYTGTCKEDPAKQAKRDALLQGSLTATGAAIGSIIPGVGNAVGAAIGAVVGFFASLFKSCDRSYEVYTKTYTVQEKCTLTRATVKITERVFSECYTVRQSIVAGYSKPRKCNCTTDICIVKARNPACVIQNEKCQDLRVEFLKQTRNIPTKFTETYQLIQQTKSNVSAEDLTLMTNSFSKDFYQNQYQQAVYTLNRIQQTSSFLNKSYENLKALLAFEKCITSYYIKYPNITDHFKILELKFDTLLPVTDNIRIDAHALTNETNKQKTVPFIVLLDDVDASLHGASKKILKELLCSPTRKRRSTENKDTLDVPFTSWYNDGSNNMTQAQLSCMTFKRATEFISSSINDLANITDDVHSLMSNIEASLHILSSNQLSSFQTKEESNFVKAQIEVLKSLNTTLERVKSTLKTDQIISQWERNGEIFTGSNNFTFCFTFKDCINTALSSLKDLPTMIKLSKEKYLDNVEILSDLWNQIFAKPESIEKLKSLIQRIKNSVDNIKAVSQHCSQPPKVKTCTDEQLVVLKNVSVTLCCDVSHSLPVRIWWKQDNKILDRENGKELNFIANQKSGGMYTCTAKSLAGETTSNGTLLVVNTKPAFLKEPKSVTFIKPSPTNPSFVCNVTAEPNATISWHFIPLSGPLKPRQLAFDDQSIITINDTDVKQSGFYYCKAVNQHGSIQSRKGRLDILQSKLASQRASLTFEVIAENISSVSDKSFTHLKGKMKINDIQNISVHFKFKSDFRGVLKVSVFAESEVHVENVSKEDMLNVASNTRQQLAKSVGRMLGDIVKNDSTIVTQNGKVLKVDNETYHSEFKGNICSNGFVPKEDGFTCVQCPMGSYEHNGKCKYCPIGTYQSNPGSSHCTACGNDYTTSTIGTTTEFACTMGKKIDNSMPKEILYAVVGSCICVFILAVLVGVLYYRRHKKTKIKDTAAKFVFSNTIPNNSIKVREAVIMRQMTEKRYVEIEANGKEETAESELTYENVGVCKNSDAEIYENMNTELYETVGGYHRS